MSGVYHSEATAPASWSESIDAREAFGPKAAGLMLVPRAWTLPFILVRASQTRDLLPPATLDAAFAEQLQSLAGEGRQIIVRSSVVGEKSGTVARIRASPSISPHRAGLRRSKRRVLR